MRNYNIEEEIYNLIKIYIYDNYGIELDSFSVVYGSGRHEPYYRFVLNNNGKIYVLAQVESFLSNKTIENLIHKFYAKKNLLRYDSNVEQYLKLNISLKKMEKNPTFFDNIKISKIKKQIKNLLNNSYELNTYIAICKLEPKVELLNKEIEEVNLNICQIIKNYNRTEKEISR